MISRLSEKARRKIAIGMVIAMPIILLSGLIYGTYMDIQDKGEAEATENADPKETVDVEESSKEDDIQSTSALEEEEQEEIYVPNQEEMQVAKTVAKDFLKVFVSFDHEDPQKYLEASKPYLTDELYEFYEAYPKRGTLESAIVEVTSLEATPGDFQEGVQVWKVEVGMDETNVEGDVKEVITSYSVLLVADSDVWKVDGVRIDE